MQCQAKELTAQVADLFRHMLRLHVKLIRPVSQHAVPASHVQLTSGCSTVFALPFSPCPAKELAARMADLFCKGERVVRLRHGPCCACTSSKNPHSCLTAVS
jgi:hypothetical protein